MKIDIKKYYKKDIGYWIPKEVLEKIFKVKIKSIGLGIDGKINKRYLILTLKEK